MDNDPIHHPDLVHDLTKPFPDILERKLAEADIIWMSPECRCFSMGSGNTHWDCHRRPKTLDAHISLQIVDVCKRVIADHPEAIYFIENPHGRLSWFLSSYEAIRHNVWYCQYGDTRAKPTWVWTNLRDWNSKSCRNGNPDCHHERAPRGSKTGTQGLPGSVERARIPRGLFEELFPLIDSQFKSSS
ncbi:hypothetical protein [Methanolobus sp. WCC4]|uniref:hypothetical protein n=1 Tax=Methanolobus sp. WCC4 TaxID=3125784 RepID=UPI0030F99CCE